jgi:Tol biopolymer transport system component
VIYPHITSFYEFEPKDKTHLILIDPDDYSNGAAYYYDNKIMIWASPLDFELRGSHRWLQNVISHEFSHIVSLQKSMKAGTKFPGAYLQLMNYEDEKRPDVLYGYPNTLISYPIPGTAVPPWLAEGIAQYMYENADWDHWDTHRDMILRDRAIYDNLLTFTEMNTFGKKGIGNESTYNAGFALSTYIANEYGPETLKGIMAELSSPRQFSVNKAIMNVLGVSGSDVYQDFKRAVEARYKRLVVPIDVLPVKGIPVQMDATTNIYPKWHPKDNGFAYLSNKQNDYFGQTDLFYFDLDTNEDKKIKSSVHSAPSWHSNGKMIYYSKKSKFPNKYGSRYYDIYSYHFDTEKEERLTVDARAFNPVYIELDSSIAYLATFDGGQDIYILDLKSKETNKVTDFRDRPMISQLTYGPSSHSLFFDITSHHYRDIYEYDISDESLKKQQYHDLYDERNMTSNEYGVQIFSQDKSGIYNLYMSNPADTSEGYITNVTGGAFMPDISANGKVIYSLFENGTYTIAILDDVFYIDEDYVGYSDQYYLNNSDLKAPIIKLDNTESSPYVDQFPNMFIMPKVMLDYGTIKPGFYFFSSEIINRLSIFGGASTNQLSDIDLFFIFDFKRFYPTLFFETYYLTRNTTDKSKYQEIYNIRDDIKFRLVQFRSGLKVPLYGSLMEVSGTQQWYRAFIQEQVMTNEYGILEAGAAYDYFRGLSLSADWSFDRIKRSLDASINPSKGYIIHARIDLEKNDFIEGLNLSESGTLLEKFKENNLTRLQVNGSYHYKVPWKNRWTLSLKGHAGWISNQNVDSFFHFYLGGIPGMRGYPFYSIQGTKSALLDVTFRMPIFMEKHYKAKWVIFQNSTLGAVIQVGDAWTDDISIKKSVGIQWRINGFSFYNFPTAIEVEYHQPLDTFIRDINETTISYGENGRAYVKVLFDF